MRSLILCGKASSLKATNCTLLFMQLKDEKNLDIVDNSAFKSSLY